MKRPESRKTRTLLSSFSSQVGNETLNVRIYRHRESLVCERELVERDGTSFTMVLAFSESRDVRDLLQRDPYYPRVRTEIASVLAKLDKALSHDYGKPARR